MIKLSLLTVLIIINITAMSGQSFSAFDLNKSGFPILSAHFFAFDNNGNQIVNFNESDFQITEDGIIRKIIDITCPKYEPVNLSSVLVMDVSYSMCNQHRLEIAISAASRWIQLLNLPKSECAITSFSENSYLNQDFSNDKKTLDNSLNSLNCVSTTNYDNAFLDPYSGAISIASKGKYNRIIIFLSDGLPNNPPNTNKIISLAKENNIKIYCVAVDMQANESMMSMAYQTGGVCFEYVHDAETIQKYYERILLLSQKVEPCTIRWESEQPCDFSSRNVKVQWNTFHDELFYEVPYNFVTSFIFKPNTVRIMDKPLGLIFDTTITVQAINHDIKISDIISDNSLFSIDPKQFSLNAGESKLLNLHFTPIDSTFSTVNFNFVTDQCKPSFNAVGGYKGIYLLSALVLTKPNGGEVFVAGSDTTITWRGIPREDTVGLEFSSDNGSSWQKISDSALGLKYFWRVPVVRSNNCLARVTNSGNSAKVQDSVLYLIEKHYFSLNETTYFNSDFLFYRIRNDSIFFLNPDTFLPYESFLNHYYQSNAIFFSKDKQNILLVGNGSAVIRKLSDGTFHSLGNSITLPLAMDKTCTLLATVNNDYLKNIYSVDIFDIASIWDNYSVSLIKKITGFKSNVIQMAFTQNSKYLITASADNTVKLWDVKNWYELQSYGGHAYYVDAFALNSDDSKIAISNYSGYIRIWETQTGKLLKTLVGLGGNYGQVAFSPSGKLVASIGSDRKLYIWNYETGKVLHVFNDYDKGNPFGFSDFVFSPDEKKLFTSNYKDIAEWSLENLYDDQNSDESDSVFAIVMPEITAQDVDMGNCTIGMNKDSIVDNFIINSGNYKCKIDSIYLLGGDMDAFRFISGIPPYSVESGESHYGEFLFTPQKNGISGSTIVIITQSDTLYKNIRGNGISEKIALENKIIDFGKVHINERKDTNQALTIRNISSSPVDITQTDLKDNGKNDFTILSGGGSFTLQPGEFHKMDIRFSPNIVGRTNNYIEFQFNDPGSPAEVQIFGEGIVNAPRIEVKLDSFPLIFCTHPYFVKLSMKNIGEEELIIDSIGILGDKLNEFSLPEFKGIYLQHDSTANYYVKFTPIILGQKFASIEIRSNSDIDSVYKADFSVPMDSIYYYPSLDTINLGILCQNEIKDTVFNLHNTSRYPVGLFFSLTPNISVTCDSTGLSPYENKPVNLHFNGLPDDGIIDEKIQIVDSLCGVRQVVYVVGSISTPKIESGDVLISCLVNETKTCKIILKNIGGREIKNIKCTQLANPFKLLNNPFPLSIPPGDSVEINVEFKSSDTLAHTSEINFTGEPCFLTAVSKISAKAYRGEYHPRAVLSAGSDSAYAGDVVNIGISLTDTVDFYESGITSLNFDLSFNPTLLQPLNYMAMLSGDKTGFIKFENVPISSPDLLNIEFRAALGNASSCPVSIRNLSSNGGDAELKIQDGFFNLLGICPEGGSRLVNPNSLVLLSVQPNPTNGSIKINLNLTEMGHTSLLLTDVSGKTVKTLLDTENDDFNSQSFSMPINDLFSGEYFLVLKTPTLIKSEKISIIK